MRRFRFGRPTPAMVVAVIALFVALGGTGYAALKLPPQSVGTKELKRNAVTTAKIDNGTLRLKDFYRPDLNRLLRRAASGGQAFDDFEDFEDFDEPVEDADGGGGGADERRQRGAAHGRGRRAAGLGRAGRIRLAHRLRQREHGRDPGCLPVAESRVRLERLQRRPVQRCPANGSVAVELLTRTLAAPAETVVLGCTITDGRPCTAAGPATLPANQLFYVRITPRRRRRTSTAAYWGVSVEP